MQQKYKHSFTDSRMNKDLDARLVSPREYRDAVNVSVSRSEGGDVGALENILGNEFLSDFNVVPNRKPVEIIGWCIDESNDRIFIFVTDYKDNSSDKLSNKAPAASQHYIVRFDTKNNTSNVIVTGSFLNFSQSSPIYHADLIENLLFWTDNRNQPRQINVETAIADNTYYSKEEHISVAKYYPYEPMQLHEEIEITNCIFVDKDYADRGAAAPPSPPADYGYSAIYDFFVINQASLSQTIIDKLTNRLGVRAYVEDETGTIWDFKIAWFQQDGVDINGNTYDSVIDAAGSIYDDKYLIFVDRDLSGAGMTKYSIPGNPIPLDPEMYTITFVEEKSKNVTDPWFRDDVLKFKLPARPIGGNFRMGGANTEFSDTPVQIFAYGTRSLPVNATDTRYSAFYDDPGFSTPGLTTYRVPNAFPSNDTVTAAQNAYPRILHPKIPITDYIVITNSVAGSGSEPIPSTNSPNPFEFACRKLTALENGGVLTSVSLFGEYGLDTDDIIKIVMPNIDYNATFPGDPQFLEDKFVRFSYRYRFNDGEYSLIAPFTQSVFIPKQGGYFLKDIGRDNQNDSRNNFIPQEQTAGETTVVDFFTNDITQVNLKIPLDFAANELANELKVDEIDILYKESNGLALKVVDTLPISDYSSVTEKFIDYEYQSRKPIKVLPEDEITRVYDNVPIRAASQASSGNRVIYGNFYDRHTSPVNLNYEVGVSRKWTSAIQQTTRNKLYQPSNCVSAYPNNTLKQNRNYQVGIVLSDKFGRQSDVILSSVDESTTVLNTGVFVNQPITFGGSTIYSKYLDSVQNPATEYADILNTTNPVAGIVDWPGDSLKVKFNTLTAHNFIPRTYTEQPGYPGLYDSIIDTASTSGSIVTSGYRRITVTNQVAQPGMILKWEENGQTLESDPIVFVDYDVTDYIYLETTSTSPPNGTIVRIVERNELGWYSYKFVIKQNQQEYYNVYLASLLAGNPVTKPFDLDISIQTSGIATVNSTITHPAADPRTFLILEGMVFTTGGNEYVVTNILNNENFTVSPKPAATITSQVVTFTTRVQNNLNVTTLLTDNTNKIPPALNDATNVQAQYGTSDTRLIPRVAYYQNYAVSTLTGGSPFFTNLGLNSKRNSQVYPGRTSLKVRALGNFFSIFRDAATAGLYEAKTDPTAAAIENTFLLGIPSETVKPDSVEPLLFSCYETTPTVSELEIFWESSTSELIYDLNQDDRLTAYREVDYFNSFWMKRVANLQVIDQVSNTSGAAVDGGSGCSARLGTWPFTNVYASPQTVNITNATIYPTTPASTGIPYGTLGTIGSRVPENFYIEEARIRGGFNDVGVDLGARAYLDEDEPIQQHRFNALIYSGVFNSRTGINRTNEFPVGQVITKAANPDNGSIQKLYAEENNLLILQENKCSRALIDKDALYTAEGGGSVTSTNLVIGQIVPYAGEYGISKNPESFAIYGFRKYFADRNRSAILRLSHDGITEISEYGMRDWFRDNLGTLNDNYSGVYTYELRVAAPSTHTSQIESFSDLSDITIGSEVFVSTDGGTTYNSIDRYVIKTDDPNNYIYLNEAYDFSTGTYDEDFRFINYNRSRIVGGWDIYNKQYVTSLQYNYSNAQTTFRDGARDNTYYTLGFDEATKGWTSFYTYRPAQLGSLKNKVYTTNNLYDIYSTGVGNFGLYMQYSNSVGHGNFYGADNPSTITFIANPNPSTQKNFLTLDYEGNSGWKVVSIESDETGFEREYAAGVPLNVWKLYIDETNQIYSYEEGAYDGLGNTGLAARADNPPLLHAGFDRKENRYVANLVNNSAVRPGEIIFGPDSSGGYPISGIKGFFATIQMSTDTATDPGGYKELYTVGTNYSISSI